MLTRFALFTALSVLVSCSSDVQDMGTQVESPFEASEISAVRVESIAANPLWSDIKNAKVMTLKTCLTDKATGAPVANESFAVNGENGEQEVRTRMDGCLYWKESFTFNYLSRQKLFEVERSITGTGHYKGSLNVGLALDLWTEGSSSVIDRSAHYIGRKLYSASQKNLFQTPGFENLYLDKVDIYATNLIHKQNHVEFDLRSVLTPVFQRRDFNGRTVKERLTAGVFDLELWLLERKAGENMFKILAKTQDTARVQNGLLDNTANIRVENRPDMRSELLIGLRLKPVNAPKGLRGLSGFVVFEELKSVSDIRPLEENLESLLYEGQAEFAADNFGFDFEENVQAIKGDLAGSAYEDGADRNYSTEFKFCLVDAFTGKRVKRGSAYVSVEDLDAGSIKEQYAQINHNGCVQIYEDLKYNELSTSYKNVRLSVRGAQAPYRDIVTLQEFRIKQWQKSGTVSFHGKAPAGEERQDRNGAKIYSKELNLTALSKNADGFHVNENMELSMTRKYVLEMPLAIVHPQNPNGPEDYASLNFGKYKVTYSMLSPKSDRTEFNPVNVRDFDLVHHTVIEPGQAKVENGILRAEIDLETAYFDFHKLLYQNMFVVRIEPINLNEVAASTFYGSAVLSKGSTRVSLGRLSDNLKDLVDVKVLYMAGSKRKIRPAGAAMTISFFRNFLKSEHNDDVNTEFETYYLNSFNEAYGQNISDLGIQKFQENNKNYLKNLCDVFYEKQEDTRRNISFRGISYQYGSLPSYQKCLANPAQYIQVEKTKHIQYLVSRPEQINGGGSSVTTGDAYFISDGNQRARDTGDRAAVGTFVEARAGGKLLPWLAVEGGVKASYEGYIMNRNSRVLNDMDRSFTNVDKKLNLEQWSLGLEADVRNCLLVTGKTSEASENSAQRTKVIHVCANSNNREYIEESWAMITEKAPEHSLVVDGRGMKENRFAQLIRGKDNFEQFISAMEDQNKVTVLRKIKNFDKGDHFENLEKQGVSVNNLGAHLDNAFPGLVD